MLLKLGIRPQFSSIMVRLVNLSSIHIAGDHENQGYIGMWPVILLLTRLGLVWPPARCVDKQQDSTTRWSRYQRYCLYDPRLLTAAHHRSWLDSIWSAPHN